MRLTIFWRCIWTAQTLGQHGIYLFGGENPLVPLPWNLENKPWGWYFSKALFEELIFGGAYIRREICVTKSIGLAYSWKESYVWLYCSSLVLFCIWGQFQHKPLGAYREGLIGRGSEERHYGRFFVLRIWGAYIWRGLFPEFYGIYSLWQLEKSASWSFYGSNLILFDLIPIGLKHAYVRVQNLTTKPRFCNFSFPTYRWLSITW